MLCWYIRQTRRLKKKIDIYPSDANTHSRNIKLYDNLLPYDIRQGSVCSVKSLGRLGHWGDMRDDSAEILFQSFLQKALVSSSGMGRDVHSLTLSIQHFLCRTRRCPPSKFPRRMVLERLSWNVTCPNNSSFRLLIVARRGSCGHTRKLILLCTQSLVLCSK